MRRIITLRKAVLTMTQVAWIFFSSLTVTNKKILCHVSSHLNSPCVCAANNIERKRV